MTSDPLTALRNCIVEKAPISLVDAEGNEAASLESAVKIRLDAESFELTTETRYKDTNTAEKFTIGAIYFAYLKKDAQHSDYFKDCQSLQFKPVSLVSKRDLFEFLEGKKESSDNIEGDVTKRENDAGDTQPKRVKFDVAAQVEVRVLQDRNSAVIGNLTGKSFEGARKMAVDLLLNVKDRKKDDKKALVSSKLVSSSAASPKAAKGGTPIIIVPSALTSLITLYNASEFLEKGCFVETAKKRQENANKETRVTLKRVFPRTGKTISYHIVDSADRLKPQEWDNVVAVFATGQAWQFKRWKWEEPAELFNNIKGFYLKYSDAAPDATINSWNVTTLEVNRYKRHLDAQCVHKFWSLVDQWMGSHKPHLFQ